MAEYIDREKIREEACKACTHRTGKNSCRWPEPCERLLWAFLNADQVDAAYTIYHETLPIVRQLREELARVTTEMDAAVGALKLTHDCNFCANDCVNPEQDYCALCHAKGCVCRTCRDGSNWVFQIPRKEARP